MAARLLRRRQYVNGRLGAKKVAVYLCSVVSNHMVVRNPGCDRPLSPWSCETVEKHGHHIHILHKLEQLRGLVSPHRKDETQNWEAGIIWSFHRGMRAAK